MRAEYLYNEENRDKIYNIILTHQNDGSYCVTVEHGCKLGVLKRQVKGTFRLEMEALTVFNKLLWNKMAKGYQAADKNKTSSKTPKPKKQQVELAKESKPTRRLDLDL